MVSFLDEAQTLVKRTEEMKKGFMKVLEIWPSIRNTLMSKKLIVLGEISLVKLSWGKLSSSWGTFRRCCSSCGHVSPSLASLSDFDKDLNRSKYHLLYYVSYGILFLQVGHPHLNLFSIPVHGTILEILQWNVLWNNVKWFSATSQQPLLDSGLGLVGDQSKIPSRNLNQVSLLQTLIQRYEPWLSNYSNLWPRQSTSVNSLERRGTKF